MNSTLSLNRRKSVKLWRCLILGMLLLPAFMLNSSAALAAPVTTPLQASGGLTLRWQEDFTNGSVDKMQFNWFAGNNAALDAFVQPGAVYLGRDGGLTTDNVEQQINNFKAADAESPAATIEFDMYSPIRGKARVSLRPRRIADMVTVLLGQANDSAFGPSSSSISSQTVVSFRQETLPTHPARDVDFAERTGPKNGGGNWGWAHVVISYRQFDQSGTLMTQYVVAINDELVEDLRPSGMSDYNAYWSADPNADGWSIEFNSPNEITMGKYIANVRTYGEFLTLADMQSRLTAAVVDPYVASLADPTTYNGATKVFQDSHRTLLQNGPNAMAYQSITNPTTCAFDGSLSSDFYKITSYAWDFGDSTTGSGRLASHTYSSGGTKNVQLTVTSQSGTNTHTISCTVSGSAPPPSGSNTLFLPFINR